MRIRHLPGEGFFANFLHVLEVLARVRPDAEVHADWTLEGDEYYFRYGSPGMNVWQELFEPLSSESPPRGTDPSFMLCITLWGNAKDYLAGEALQRQRDRYHEVFTRWVKVRSPRVLEVVEELSASAMRGRFAIGVHRRVGNVLVAALQASGVAPDVEALIARVNRIVEEKGRPDHVVFLATDDEAAVEHFRAAFGERLLLREGVKRTTATGPEVHAKRSGDLGLADAEDVLIDALLLARCDVLVHASSSVSTSVSFMNAGIELVRA